MRFVEGKQKGIGQLAICHDCLPWVALVGVAAGTVIFPVNRKVLVNLSRLTSLNLVALVTVAVGTE